MAWSQRMRPLIAVVAFALLGSGCAWITQLAELESEDTGVGDIAVSGDGRYVAFQSSAADLVDDDTNGVPDVFVRDMVNGSVTRISVASNEAEGDGLSSTPALSADGRYVAFESEAANLVPNDTNGVLDVFVRDTVMGTTARLSVDSGENQASGESHNGDITPDGRYVAFVSSASNLVASDENDVSDVFVRDLSGGTTRRVSISSGGTEGNGNSLDEFFFARPAVSDDGRRIAFWSEASNLVPGDTNGVSDIFIRDRVAGVTRRASVSSEGAQGTFVGSEELDISGDGRFVAFVSSALGLVPGMTVTRMLYLRDLAAGTTTVIGVRLDGRPVGSVVGPSISADGRYVAFHTFANGLVANETNGIEDVFVRDTVTNTTTRASVGTFGEELGIGGYLPVLSADGRYVAFLSAVGPNTGPWDYPLFLKANPQPAATSADPSALPRGGTSVITVTGSGFIDASRAVIEGGGVTVTNHSVVSPSRIDVEVAVAPDASPSQRDVIIVNPGTGPGALTGAAALCAGCLTIE